MKFFNSSAIMNGGPFACFCGTTKGLEVAMGKDRTAIFLRCEDCHAHFIVKLPHEINWNKRRLPDDIVERTGGKADYEVKCPNCEKLLACKLQGNNLSVEFACIRCHAYVKINRITEANALKGDTDNV